MNDKIPFRVNLSATIFPFYSRLHGRTVIIPRIDQNVDRININRQDADKDSGIPQVYFMENVIPTDYGFSSVGYKKVVNAISSTAKLQFLLTLKDTDGTSFLYALVIDPATPSNSGDYKLTVNASTSVWQQVVAKPALQLSDITEDYTVTQSFVQGQQFLCFYKTGFVIWNGTTFTPATFNGLTPENIKGILSVGSYNIAYDDQAIYWSSLADPTDFVPSLATGAGAIVPSDLKGPIVVCRPLKEGFLIYTTNNVVSATLTDSVEAPFYFREVSGSVGISKAAVPAELENTPSHIVATALGVQQIDKSNAKVIFPEVADFIGNRIIEYYDPVQKKFIEDIVLDEHFLFRVTSVTSRYLLASFGRKSTNFTHALFYDYSLNKWGRLKFPHAFIVLWPYNVEYLPYLWLTPGTKSWEDYPDWTWNDANFTALAGAKSSKQLIAFVQEDGEIYIVSNEFPSIERSGIFILGKYQVDRRYFTSLLDISVECVNKFASFDTQILSSVDGSNIATVISPYLKSKTDYTRDYLCKAVALNHSICFIGAFDLSSVILTCRLSGSSR